MSGGTHSIWDKPSEPCAAGTTAFFGGRWKLPCFRVGNNVIGANDSGINATVALCDEHFAEVNAAGLVDEPYMDPHQWERKMER